MTSARLAAAFVVVAVAISAACVHSHPTHHQQIHHQRHGGGEPLAHGAVHHGARNPATGGKLEEEDLFDALFDAFGGMCGGRRKPAKKAVVSHETVDPPAEDVHNKRVVETAASLLSGSSCTTDPFVEMLTMLSERDAEAVGSRATELAAMIERETFLAQSATVTVIGKMDQGHKVRVATNLGVVVEATGSMPTKRLLSYWKRQM